MTVTVLALTSLRPGGEAALETYLAVVGPLMEAAGARLVSRHATGQTLSDSAPAEFVSLIDYPSVDALRQVFDNPAYLALKPVLDRAFSRYEVCVLEPQRSSPVPARA